MDATRKLTIRGDKKGFALVYIALLIFVLFGTLGLAVDAGHMYVVRGQLQNAADAAALAGAWSLYRPFSPGAVPTLDWGRAQTGATDFIQQNKTDNAALATGTVETGYWNLSLQTLRPTTITPTSQDVPAVRVTIGRSAGNNGGPVSTFFMKVLDASMASVAVSSRPAVAVSGPLGAVAPNTLFPMAISKCMTDIIFSPANAANLNNTININSPYVPGGPSCYSGQWTSFKLDSNNVTTIMDLMKYGNPDPLALGDDIWIEPGAKDTLYQIKKWPFSPPQDVVMAVVDSEMTDLKTKGERTITGFVTFRIDGTQAVGSDKYVYGHFIAYSDTYPAGASPGGSASNIVTPPLMVQ